MHRTFIILSLLVVSCTAPDSTRKVNFKLSGEGKPTIVICTAMGETRQTWDSLQTELAKLSTVVSYDRFGLGLSDTTTSPRTLANLSRELDEFLSTNEIEAPYLLIGHSLGASLIRKYQNDQPEKVAGLLLIDPTHPDQFEELMNLKTAEEREETHMWREFFLASLKPGELNEAIQYHPHIEELKEINFPKDIPITLLGSFKISHGSTPADREVKERLYLQWQNEAPQLKLVKTVKSGHYIQDTEPELLLGEVKSMLEEYR